MLKYTNVGGKRYPKIILGADHFTSWFSKTSKNYNSEKERADEYRKCLQTIHALGFIGYSIPPHKTLISVLEDHKGKNPEIICISNPHYGKHYYLNGESLWSTANWKRLTATLSAKLGNSEKSNWLGDLNLKPYSQREIENITLDEEEYESTLREFETFCDFSLIGNLHRSALLVLGRRDIVERESELVKKHSLTPLLMCEAGKIALEKGKDIDCAGYWVYMNEDFGYPNINELVGTVERADKPITAYKAFTRKNGFNVNKTLDFFSKLENVKSLVVGVEDSAQAKETFKQIQGYF